MRGGLTASVARATGRRREVAVAYALMTPALVLVLGVLAYPLAWEVWISLSNFSSQREGRPAFVGLANYRKIVQDAQFWWAMATTVVYFGVTTVAKLVLGVAMALLLATPSRARPFVFLAVFLPWAYPGGVAVVAWYWMLNPPLITSYSVFAGNLKHAVDAVFGGGAYTFASVMLFNIWRGGSFTAVFLLAGLNAIPTELFEYARLETRSASQRFWQVTLPLLRPYMALAVFLSFTTAFADLANVWMLTGGRIIFPVIGTQAYWLGIRSGQFGEAAALSLSLVPLLVAALCILFRWFDPPQEKDEEEVLQLANDVRYGLAAGIWTTDVKRAHRLARELQAGTVWINTYRNVSFASPFGGYKESGYGRENGLEALKEYTQVKSVWIELGGPMADPFVLR